MAHNKTKHNKKMKKLKYGTLAVMLAAPLQASAAAAIDLTTAGTEIAGYVAVAAAAGVAIFIAIMGIRVVKKAFKSAAS